MTKKQDIQFEQPSDILLLLNKYLTIFLALIVLAILLLGYYLLLSPKIVKIQDIKLATGQYVDEQNRDEMLISDLKNLETKYKNILATRQSDLEEISKIFPDKPQYAELFVMAEKLAIDRGFRLKAVEFVDSSLDESGVAPPEVIRDDAEIGQDAGFQIPQSPSNDLGIKSVIIQMQIYTPADLLGESKVDFGEPVVEQQSHYEAFKLFLDDMERNLRIMDIESISFDSQEEDPTISELFDFTIVTYYKD